MPNHPPQYKVIRTEDFVQKTQLLRKTYSRIPELIDAADWMLMRKPHTFMVVADQFYLWRTDKLTNPEFPMINILYKIDETEKTVTMIAIDDVID